MKRTLLNQIFQKFPTLGNMDKLIDLNCVELSKILECESISLAKETLNKIITMDSKKEKNLILSLSMFYINY